MSQANFEKETPNSRYNIHTTASLTPSKVKQFKIKTSQSVKQIKNLNNIVKYPKTVLMNNSSIQSQILSQNNSKYSTLYGQFPQNTLQTFPSVNEISSSNLQSNYSSQQNSQMHINIPENNNNNGDQNQYSNKYLRNSYRKLVPQKQSQNSKNIFTTQHIQTESNFDTPQKSSHKLKFNKSSVQFSKNDVSSSKKNAFSNKKSSNGNGSELNLSRNSSQKNIFLQQNYTNGHSTVQSTGTLVKVSSNQSSNFTRQQYFEALENQLKDYREEQRVKNIIFQQDKMDEVRLIQNLTRDEQDDEFENYFTNRMEQDKVNLDKNINIIQNREVSPNQEKLLHSQQIYPDLFRHYKRTQKLTEASDITKKPVSPFIQMLNKSQQKRLNPKRYGLLNSIGPNKQVKSGHYRLGDEQGELFSIGLKTFSDEVEDLDLSTNNLSDAGMKKVLASVSHRIKKMNLSYNKFGMGSCLLLESLLENSSSQLTYLNLEGNNLGNKAVKLMVQACIESNSSLKILNLSKNKLTSSVCQNLKQYLSENSYLQELYLYWNEIQNEGFQAIGEALLKNYCLKVLDLSFNGIGGDVEIAKIWAQVFKRDENIDLLHVDFSYNKFTMEETEIFSEALEENHGIYGFHYRGNPGKVCCKGFLRLKEREEIQRDLDLKNNKKGEWMISQRINGVKALVNNKYLANCWICEGWQDVKFVWTPKKSGPVDKPPIFIHFCFDEFVPHQMQQQEDGSFSFSKMCPPNEEIQYFFTAAGNQLVAQDLEFCAHDVDKKIGIQFADTLLECHLAKMNIVQTQKNLNLIDEHDYKINTKLQPRRYEKINYLPPKENIKIAWKFENSIFKTYKKDTEELLNQCFEFDWACCKIDRLLKSEEEKASAKTFFKNIYPVLKNAYKHQASINPTGEIWSISQNVYSEMLTQAGVVDLNYGLKDADFNFIATNSGLDKWKQQNNPPRAVIRFQFMEIIIRNIIDKYLKTQQTESFNEALNFAYENGLQEYLDSISMENDWKEKVYWNEHNDNCLRKYQKIVEYVYKRYAGSKNKELVKIKFINFSEFKYFVADSGLGNGDLLTERDVNMAFNLAIMSQVDEITRNRHMELQVVEFYESLARLAHAYSPIPFSQEKNEEFWTQEKRKHLPLHIKLEGLILMLYNRYAPHDRVFKDENPLPEKSIFSAEIEDILEGRKSVSHSEYSHQNKQVKMVRKPRQSVQMKGFLNNLRRGSQQQSSIIFKTNTQSSLDPDETPKSVRKSYNPPAKQQNLSSFTNFSSPEKGGLQNLGGKSKGAVNSDRKSSIMKNQLFMIPNLDDAENENSSGEDDDEEEGIGSQTITFRGQGHARNASILSGSKTNRSQKNTLGAFPNGSQMRKKSNFKGKK